MMRYWYVVDVNPIPWRVGPVGAARSSDGKRFKGYVGRDAELDNYKKAVAAELQKQNPRLLDESVQLDMWFWRNLASYATEKRAKGAGDHVADGSNMYKATEDACQGVLFTNDRHNVAGHWYIVDQGPVVTGKVIICVSTIGAHHTDDILQLIPDEVYEEAFKGEQIALAMEVSKPDLAPDGSSYAEADQIF